MVKFLAVSPTGAPGKKEYAWNQFRDGEYVAIGWLNEYNLEGKSIDEITSLIMNQEYSNEANVVNSFTKFLSLDIGDYVAVNNVNHGLFGIGEITSGYKYKKNIHNSGHEDGHCYSHIRKVKWLSTRYVKRKDIVSKDEKACARALAILYRSTSLLNNNSSKPSIISCLCDIFFRCVFS